MGFIIKQWCEHQNFNEHLFTKVDSIEKQINKVPYLGNRLKRIENSLF